jgi:hypothetical protein
VHTGDVAGVHVTERIAIAHGAVVAQWSVDRRALLHFADLPGEWIDAGETHTRVLYGARGLDDIVRAFTATAGDVRRAVERGFTIHSSDGTGNALAWAVARLALHAPHGEASLAHALAALAAGQHDVVHARLPFAAPDLLPLLAARYAAWSGEPHGLQPFRNAIRDAVRTFGSVPAADPAHAAIRVAGLAELERTATDLGDAAFAAELHSAARQLKRDIGALLDERAALMLGALGVIESPNFTQPQHSSDDVAIHAWRTWARLTAGDGRAGLDDWRRLLAEASAPVRGAWPARFGQHDFDPDATALFITTLAHGLLGIEPDAARHRLRVRPKIGPEPATVDARAIRFGDASISLRIERDERSIRITAAQDEGAIPATVLLEPVFSGRVRGTWIDRRPAALDVRPLGDCLVVSVQLVLDDERSLVVELDPDG